MDHVNTPINEIVVMYQSAEQVIRPPGPTDVSVCKGIMSYFSFLLLGVPRHYAKRPFNCWCKACSRVRGRGLGSQSSGPDLLVSDCTRTKQTAWTEDQFTDTSSSGIRNREKRVPDIVVRELKRAKPDVWGCIQAHEVWSTEEEDASWTLLDLQVRDGSWSHDLRREEVRVAGPQVQVGGVQGHQVLRRGQRPRR
jgi:hypothetical protein